MLRSAPARIERIDLVRHSFDGQNWSVAIDPVSA